MDKRSKLSICKETKTEIRRPLARKKALDGGEQEILRQKA
jgi:hypothetical protein